MNNADNHKIDLHVHRICNSLKAVHVRVGESGSPEDFVRLDRLITAHQMESLEMDVWSEVRLAFRAGHSAGRKKAMKPAKDAKQP